jgi:acetate kinase
MGTRSGDIDHSVFYMVNTLGYSLDAVNNLLLKESGMLGLTGFSDLREIELKQKRKCIVSISIRYECIPN